MKPIGKKWRGPYVIHECRKCHKAFVAEDYMGTEYQPPKWRYCPECAKEKGIVYSEQTPKTNRTPEENEKYRLIGERLKNARCRKSSKH